MNLDQYIAEIVTSAGFQGSEVEEITEDLKLIICSELLESSSALTLFADEMAEMKKATEEEDLDRIETILEALLDNAQFQEVLMEVTEKALADWLSSISPGLTPTQREILLNQLDSI